MNGRISRTSLSRIVQAPLMGGMRRTRVTLAAITYGGGLLWLQVHGLFGGHAWMALRVMAACQIMTASLWLAFCALPARAAHQNRWPHMTREAVLAVWWYAAVAVIVPTVAFGSLRPAWVMLALLTNILGVACGLFYMLATRRTRSLAILVLIVLINSGLDDATTHMAWLLTSMTAAAGLACLYAVFSWRRMVYREDDNGTELLRMHGQRARETRKPQKTWQLWNMWIAPRLASLAHWRDSLVAQIDVSRTGPCHPVASIRVAIGGFDPPVSPGAHVLRTLWFLLGAAMLGVFVVATQRTASPATAQQVVHMVDLGGLLTAQLACLMVTLRLAGGRWHRRVDLTLLALLPGLGNVDQARRHRLLAILGKPLGTLFGLWLCMLFLCAWQPTVAPPLALCSAMVWVCMSFCLGFVLRTLGGSCWSPALAWYGLSCLLLFTAAMVVSLLARQLGLQPLVWTLTVLLVFAGFGWAALGWIGWRRFVRRPHAFVACGAQTGR